MVDLCQNCRTLCYGKISIKEPHHDFFKIIQPGNRCHLLPLVAGSLIIVGTHVASLGINRKQHYPKLIEALQCSVWIMSLGFDITISLGGMTKSIAT